MTTPLRQLAEKYAKAHVNKRYAYNAHMVQVMLIDAYISGATHGPSVLPKDKIAKADSAATQEVEQIRPA